MEFGVPDDQDATDAAMVERYHPAVGHTDRTRCAGRRPPPLGPDGFARAYGCWNPPAEIGSTEIDADGGRPAGSGPMPGSLPVVFGFDVGPGRDWAVVAAGRDPAGRVWLDVVDTGTRPDRRLVELVTRLYRTHRPRPLIGVDDAGPARDVADTIETAGVPLTRPAGRDYAAACAAFADTVNADRVRHRGHPELDAAVAALATRPLGDAFAWSRRRSAGTIAPAVAATVAAWVLEHAPVLMKPVIASRR